MAGTEKQRKQFLSRKSQEGDLLSRKNFSLAYTYHDVTSIYASMYSTMGELQNNLASTWFISNRKIGYVSQCKT